MQVYNFSSHHTLLSQIYKPLWLWTLILQRKYRTLKIYWTGFARCLLSSFSIVQIFSTLGESLLFYVLLFLTNLMNVKQRVDALFNNNDYGHLAYVGFLRLQGLYRNPAMRSFIQILIESRVSSIAHGYWRC